MVDYRTGSRFQFLLDVKSRDIPATGPRFCVEAQSARAYFALGRGAVLRLTLVCGDLRRARGFACFARRRGFGDAGDSTSGLA
jgi:hypothetical protein